MAWARFDDRYWMHPKLLEAGLEARGLDVAAICWSAGMSSDGFVPETALRQFGDSTRTRRRAIGRLVAVGRWTHDEQKKGYWIHDFLDYNPSRAEVEKRRQAERDRKALGRRDQGRSRSGRITSERTPTGSVPDSARIPAGHDPAFPPGHPPDSERTSERTPRGVPPVPSRPGPFPSPTSPTTSTVVRPDNAGLAAGGDGDARASQPHDDEPTHEFTPLDGDPDFERFAAIWPGRPRMRAESRTVMRQCREIAADELIDEAVGYLLEQDTPPRHPSYLLATVRDWLRQRGGVVEP